jgi:hypothetical protein
MAAGRGRQPASPSAVTRRWECPARLRFARRSGVDCRGDKSDGDELQLTLNTHATEPLKFFRIHTQ